MVITTVYIPYLIENPDVLIRGYGDNPIWYQRSPHNFFLLMTYNCGLLFPALFLFFLIKIMNWSKRNLVRFNISYMVLPYLLLISTINSEGSGIFLWLLLAISPYLKIDNYDQKTL